MGCIKSSSEVIVCTIEAYNKETKDNLLNKKIEGLNDKDFLFLDEIEDDTSNFSEQSEIPIKAKMEKNEIIFL